jgi:hypothetical protein
MKTHTKHNVDDHHFQSFWQNILLLQLGAKKAKPCVVAEGRGREEVLAEMFVWDAY